METKHIALLFILLVSFIFALRQKSGLGAYERMAHGIFVGNTLPEIWLTLFEAC
jgi:hypothetical protein